MKPIRMRMLVLGFAVVLSTVVESSNGINPVGFGSRSSLIGGADIAYPLDSLTININPAGLHEVGERFDVYLQPFMTMNTHEDRYSGETDSGVKYGAVGGVGYTRPFNDGPVAMGVALLVQGGLGFSYENIDTAFGTNDDTDSLFTAIKLSPSVSWRVNERTSLGISFSTIYTEAEASVFPRTSFTDVQQPEKSFYGIELSGASGYTFGGKVGVLYRVSDALRLGMAYSLASPMVLENGDVKINLSSLNMGTVRYRRGQVDKLSFPEELGFAVNYHLAAHRTRLLAELSWINWSEAVDRIRIAGARPDNPSAPPNVAIDIQQSWRDQYVVALGLSRELSRRLTLLSGINYGRNPVPNRNVTPTLAVISEWHVSLGLDIELDASNSVVVGLEYQAPTSARYSNIEAPYGSGAKEYNEAIFLHFTYSRQLSRH